MMTASSKSMADKSVQRTGAGRVAPGQMEHHRRLAPVADLCVVRYEHCIDAMVILGQYAAPPYTAVVGGVVALLIILGWILYRGRGAGDGCNIGGTAGGLVAGLVSAFSGPAFMILFVLLG